MRYLGWSEPAAPFWLAGLLVAVYLVSTIGLTVVLAMDTELLRIAPAIFPILAVVGTVNIALRAQHKHRLARIANEHLARQADEAARKAERKAERQARVNQRIALPSNDRSVDGSVDRLQAGRAAKKASIIDAMLDAYRVNPHVGDTELGGM